MKRSDLPVPSNGAAGPRAVSGVIERVISEVPAPQVERSADPGAAADDVARSAARNAAMLSGSLALPPGPLGMLTVLPDLYLIWKIQRQMVADIFALHGRAAELTATHMLYCLFRHMASHVLRDIAVRAGQRAIVRQLSSAALTNALGNLGVTVTQRVVGTSVGRWIPLAGAAAVGAYAYWDTLQVAKTARQVLASTPEPANSPVGTASGSRAAG
ncbi:MAG TPA: hypothetical protein VMU96_13135 [Casimicrobiaceae bacterium]|nr:hypothetical protein [Casimicrobiaceae bacterium]